MLIGAWLGAGHGSRRLALAGGLVRPNAAALAVDNLRRWFPWCAPFPRCPSPARFT